MRKKNRNVRRPLRRLAGKIKKIGTLNLILILVGGFFLWFNAQMLNIFRACGAIPETYACAVIAATIGECGICGWIRTTKDKQRDRSAEMTETADATETTDTSGEEPDNTEQEENENE